MPNTDLVNFVQAALSKGYSKEQISNEMIQKGYSKLEVEGVFQNLEEPRDLESDKSQIDPVKNTVGSSYFLVSPLKLAIFSIFTFGLYDYYWAFRQWRKIAENEGLKLHVFLRTVFMYPFYSYSLFRRVRALGNNKVQPLLFTVILAILLLSVLLPINIEFVNTVIYIAAMIIWTLPLIATQQAINKSWPDEYNIKKKFTFADSIVLMIGIPATFVYLLLRTYPHIIGLVPLKIFASKANNPELYVTPVPRIINSTQQFQGDTAQFDGISVNSPWGNQIKSFAFSDGLHIFEYSDKRVIGIHSRAHSQSLNISNILKNEYSDTESQLIMSELYGGEQNMQDGSLLLEYLYSITPENVGIIGKSPRDLTFQTTLLVMRSGFSQPEYQYGIYTFSTGAYKGIQYSDPSYSKTILIDLFDSLNNQYTLVLKGTMTQDEIDYIINSFKVM